MVAAMVGYLSPKALAFGIVLVLMQIQCSLNLRSTVASHRHEQGEMHQAERHHGMNTLFSDTSMKMSLSGLVSAVTRHIPWSPLGPWSPLQLGQHLFKSEPGEKGPINISKHVTAENSSYANGSMPVLFAIGGGTGAHLGGVNTAVNRDLLMRMHYQDKALMFLVLMVYLLALSVSASITYRQASNSSPVTYYADPRFHTLAIEGYDLDMFLDTFNQAPKNITLQVTGFLPVAETPYAGRVGSASVDWHGDNYQVAFTFSLDLSPWVQRASEVSRSGQMRSLNDGVLPEDRSVLYHHLTNSQNALSYVELVKEVAWPGWEELATNIKHHIRQKGFGGVIVVKHGETDEIQVYKNRPWANFMHARATRVLCALSIIGWLIYVPYMWLRCTKVSVHSHYRVDVSISDYWRLIADKLSATGFGENSTPTDTREQSLQTETPPNP